MNLMNSNDHKPNDASSAQPQSATSTAWKLKDEVALHYRCDVRTITNLMRRRVLPFVKVGRLVRFDLDACDEAMRKYERRSVVV